MKIRVVHLKAGEVVDLACGEVIIAHYGLDQGFVVLIGPVQTR